MFAAEHLRKVNPFDIHPADRLDLLEEIEPAHTVFGDEQPPVPPVPDRPQQLRIRELPEPAVLRRGFVLRAGTAADDDAAALVNQITVRDGAGLTFCSIISRSRASVISAAATPSTRPSSPVTARAQVTMSSPRPAFPAAPWPAYGSLHTA